MFFPIITSNQYQQTHPESSESWTKAHKTHQFFAGCGYRFADVILSLWYFESCIPGQFQKDWMLSFSFCFTQKRAEGGG